MAQQAPEGLDVTELKFKLQSKVPIFKGNGVAKDGCNLLAAASVHGLVFAGTFGAELRVLRLKDITVERTVNDLVPLRTVPLPSEPNQLAVSCDHGFLAVDVVANGVPFIYIYSVPSFLTGSIVKLHEIRTSPHPGVRCTQICWNPVIHNMLCVRTEIGGLSVYTLKEPTGLEFHSLDGNAEQAQCACWSPKGKQLVVAFANGKLVQYKPDLKPARTIVCPPGVVEGGGGFNVLAVQWLSTYQFAVVFLPHAPDSVPALFIVNAPKVGNPVLINYDDVCYSQSGPRKGQVFLLHILPWNLLLMASANSIEVGILGTTESGEAPTWCQWTTTDEARAELPLTVDKQESFPVGFALETGCTHELLIGEQTYPVMPMIHLLSTYGQLVSFNVLNTAPKVPIICCPPQPAPDLTGGAFVTPDFGKPAPQMAPTRITTGANVNIPTTGSSGSQQPADISFAVPTGATSTPAIPKTKSFFNAGLGSGEGGPQNSPVSLFGSVAGQQAKAAPAAAIAPTFGKQIAFGSQPETNAASSPFGTFAAPTATSGGFGGGNSVGSSLPTMSAPPFQSIMSSMAPSSTPVYHQTSTFAPASTAPIAADANKPLVTVPPTYVPPTPIQPASQPTTGAGTVAVRPTKKSDLSTEDNNAIIRALTVDELKRFARELADLQQRSRSVTVQIGAKEESATIIRNLRELEDIIAQANESTESLVADVQALRLGLNEAFAMVAEANSKSAIYSNPTVHQYQEAHVMSQTSRRQLAALESMLQVNENQLRTATKQLGAQWMALEEAKETHVRQRMHIPSLEVLYQTLSKQQEILNRQSEKLGYLKQKLGLRGTLKGLETSERGKKQYTDDESAIESLTDSIISMTLGEQVAADTKKLSEPKLAALRNVLVGRQVVTVKPKRPERVGLRSEVVRERRDEAKRMNFEQEKTKAQNASQVAVIARKEADQKKLQQQQQQQQQQQYQQQQQQQHYQQQQQAHKHQHHQQTQQRQLQEQQKQHQQQQQKQQQQQQQQQQEQQKQQQQQEQPKQQQQERPVIKPLGTSASNKAFAFPAQPTVVGAGVGSFSFGQTTITPMASAADPPPKLPTAGGNISTGLSFGAVANKENADRKAEAAAAKENAPPGGPVAKTASSGLFSFGSAVSSTLGGAAFKPPAESSDSGGAGNPVYSFAGVAGGGSTQQQQPVMSFGSMSKPAFSFDPSTSSTASATFGNGAALPFGSSGAGAASEGPLNLGKPKQAAVGVTNENVAPAGDEARKDKPLPPSFGPGDNVPTKSPLPALTSLLQKVDSSAVTVSLDSTAKASSPKAATPAASGVSGGGFFGASNRAVDFEGGIFASVSKANNNTSLAEGGTPAKGSNLFSGVTFGTTTITPVVAASSATATGGIPATKTTTSGGSLFGSVKPDAAAVVNTGTGDGLNFGTNSFTVSAGTTTVTSSSVDHAKSEGRVEPSSVGGSLVASVVSSTNTTTTAVSTSSTSSGGFAFGSLPSTGKPLAVSAPVASAVVSSTAPATTAPTATDPTSGMFESISICTPSTLSSPKTAVTSTGNIFSTGAFGSAKPAGGGDTASIFGGGASATGGGSIFAAAAATASVPSSFGAAASPPTAAASSGGGLFGSVTSPTVASSTGSVFGANANNRSTISTTSTVAGGIFGGAASGGGFFGSGSASITSTANSGFGAGTTGSIFGTSASTTASPGGGNIFGAPLTAASGTGGGLFGSVAGGNNNALPSGGGGSIFSGTSAFGGASAGGGNIFGSPVATTQGATAGTGLFGTFGSPHSPATASTQSIFGGGASAAGSSPFGAAPSAFGSPAGGGAVSAFSKPASSEFGATATFGGTPTFGGAPSFSGAATFGGAATFASPKATFGGAAGFSAAAAPAAIGSPTQSNNLFEQLGSSSTGVSFGGLAQQQGPKPSNFGGSSFSSWRS